MGNKVSIIQFAVGDGSGVYYQPTSGMTALKNEVWRGNVSEVAQNEDSSNIIDVTGVIPSDAGGFTIREMGAFDASGKLIAVANTPDTAKVVIADGSSSEMSIKMEIAVSNAEVINFTLDPTVIIATKKDLEKHTKNYENPHKVTAAQVGASNPNLLINPCGNINQRGASSYSTSSAYTLDRWIYYIDHGSFIDTIFPCNSMVSMGEKCIRMAISSFTSPGYDLLAQIIEDSDKGLSPLSGKTVTFSVLANTTGDYRLIGIYYYDSSDTAHCAGFTNIPKGITGRYSITATIPVNSHRVYVAISSSRNLTSADVGTYCDFTEAKLEISSVVTLFSPRSNEEELSMCRRYCYPLPYTGHYRSVVYNGNVEYFCIIPPEPMRVTPTIRMGTENTDWSVTTSAYDATQSGFVLSVSGGSNGESIMLMAAKASHGLTDNAIFSVLSSRNYLDAEIY